MNEATVAPNWKDYELLDAGDGEKLERWGEWILRRPDPQAIWPVEPGKHERWDKPDMRYLRQETGGKWKISNTNMPEAWTVEYQKLKFLVKPSAFKHTALFPEQAVNWEYIGKKVAEAKGDEFQVLNLFAYTGGATLAAAAAGASEVVHIDSSRPAIEVAKENLQISGLGSKRVRFIAEDALSFVKREVRRGRRYQAIIMDPPPFGRGEQGQVWKLNDDLPKLVALCRELLADDASFLLISTYATEVTHNALGNLLELEIKSEFKGEVESGDLSLPITAKNLTLPCGIYAKWESS